MSEDFLYRLQQRWLLGGVIVFLLLFVLFILLFLFYPQFSKFASGLGILMAFANALLFELDRRYRKKQYLQKKQ